MRPRRTPSMESPKTRILPPPSRVSPGQLEEALLHWDELDEVSLVTLASHPRTAKRLAGLRAAERYLRQGAPQLPLPELLETETLAAGPFHPEIDAGDCPSAEELYDLGRGPGSGGLASERETRLRDHLRDCAPCTALLRTLASPPPLPLELGALEEAPRRTTAAPARPLRRSTTWAPFLVAASLAGLALLPQLLNTGYDLGDLPGSPILRGEFDDGMHFPRGRVLARPTGTDGPPRGWLTFEVGALEGADGYRVEVFRHAGGAFDEGDRLQLLRAAGPILEGDTLPTGTYSWRAWAEVDGLERSIGTREFQVVEDHALAAKLTALEAADRSSPGELVECVRELHEAGFRTDARRVARSLPESPERDAYLQPPGR